MQNITFYYIIEIVKKIFFLLLISVFLNSCSLKYETASNAESTLPEFTFNDVRFTRYENSNMKMEIEAEQLEQYKNADSSYGKDVSFSVYNDENKIETTGSCNYLGIDTKKEIYELFDNIKIHSEKQNLDVTGKKFRWNGKNEQLISGRNDMVTIEKDGMTIHGSGFSASGVSSSFGFTGVVTGEIETKDTTEKTDTPDKNDAGKENEGAQENE